MYLNETACPRERTYVPPPCPHSPQTAALSISMVLACRYFGVSLVFRIRKIRIK